MDISGNLSSLNTEDQKLLEKLKPRSGHIFDIYSSGKSGAIVLILDLKGGEELQGPHVVKIQDEEIGEKEFNRHQEAQKTSISNHIPEIVDIVSEEGRVATLYKLAGGHLLNVQPLEYLIQSDITRAITFIRKTIELLIQLNPLSELKQKRKTSDIVDILQKIINIGKERLNGPESLLKRLEDNYPGIDKPILTFEGTDRVFPNPIAYAYKTDLWEKRQLIYLEGFVHSDLHCENVICDLQAQKVFLIDWGAFENEALSFFDWAYLEIDLLLRFMQCKNTEDWSEWVYISEFSNKSILPDGEPKGRQAPMAWKLIQPIRENIQTIVNSITIELREWVEISFLISSLAACLNFVRKKSVVLPLKNALLLYSAQCLDRSLRLLNIRIPSDQPSHISIPRPLASLDWENIGFASQLISESNIIGTDIFLSFSDDDYHKVRKIAEDLQSRGFSVFFEQSGIKSDDERIVSIANGINMAPIFISMISSTSKESIMLRREYLVAESKGKIVIPVLIDKCKLPDYIRDKKSFNLESNYSLNFDALVKFLPNPLGTIHKANDISPSRRLLEQAYLDRLLFKYERWLDLYTPMSGIAEQVSTKNRKISVSPATMNPLFELLNERKEMLGIAAPKEPYRVTSILEEIRLRKRVVLLGEPGAGKSTTLWRLISDLATNCIQNPESPIPVLIPMGSYDGKSDLVSYIQKNSETLLGELVTYFPKLLEEKRIAMLLDGLNEMPRACYETAVQKVKLFIEDNPNILVVITCRELDYTVDMGLDRIRIKPLDPIQIKAFLRNYLKDEGENLFWKLIDSRAKDEYWFRFEQAGGNEFDFWLAQEEPKVLKAPWNYWDWPYWLKIRENPRSYLGIARNPFMLFMIAQVYITDESLPKNRGQLFRLFVDVLMRNEKEKCREEEWVNEKEQREALSRLAFSMQMSGEQGTSIEYSKALGILGDEKILHLTASENILQIGENVRFSHQLLQEFFAAYALDQERIKGKSATEFWPPSQWWKPVGWEETSVLLAGLYNDEPLTVLNWLRDSNPELAARCLRDGGIDIKTSIRQMLVAAWLPRLMDLKEPVLARAAIGRALGLIDADSRPGVCLIDDHRLPVFEWCDVPEGEFIAGEKSERTVNLPWFQISKYMVTNAQYQPFIEDGGYTEKWRRCWTNTGWIKKGERNGPEDYSETHNLPNHPRVGVNWYEAVAFCNWLNIQFRSFNKIQGGYEIRLPTENEWEKAARGEDGRLYPWGNEFQESKCNVINIESTTAVGIFPDGSSPYGVLDMVGNAWKWCLTKWREDSLEPEDNSLEGSSKRVYRGGSWGSDVWRTNIESNEANKNTAYKISSSPASELPSGKEWSPHDLHCGRRYWIVPEDDRPDAIGFFIVLGLILPK